MNYQNLVLGTLSNDAFVMVNKKFMQKLGAIEAILINEMISIHKMVKANNAFFNNKDDGKDWFFITQPYIEKHLGIKRTMFQNAMKNLEKAKVFEKKMLDVPAKNHYVMDWERIALLLSEIDEKDLPKNPNEPKNSEKIDEKASQSPPQSACMKPATLVTQNVQSSLHETSNLGYTKPTPIRITNNNNIQNKSFDDDENILNNINEPKLMTFDIMEQLPTGMVATENPKEARLQIYRNFYNDLKAWLFDYGITHKKVSQELFNALYNYEFYVLFEQPTKAAIEDILEKIKKGLKYSSLGGLLASNIINFHQEQKGQNYVEEQQKLVALYNLQQAEAVKHIAFYNWLDEREESPMQIEESDLSEDEDIFAAAYERLKSI